MLSQWISQLFRQLRTRTNRPLPKITIKKSFNYYKSFTSPAPDINAIIYNDLGAEVAHATYALSPLQDRLYIFTIEVRDEYQRHGYGMALLTHLASNYGQPIVPIQELYSANEFWHAAREIKLPNLRVRPPLSVSEMDSERNRWQHLQPEMDRLERLISERLSTHHEAWEVAISRGLESNPSAVVQ